MASTPLHETLDTTREGTRESPALLCPNCGFNATHVDTVTMAGRGEDGPFTYTRLGASGCTTLNATAPPVGDMVGAGRRHRIVLEGWCENGCNFAVVFTQHKGTTFVETVA